MENTTQQTGYPSIDKPWLKYYDKVFLDKPLPAMNIYSYLKEMTKNCLDKTAITYYGKEITYKKLFQNIESVAQLLVRLGVQAEDRIMYLMPNIPETTYFFYAGARIGAVADYVDPRPDSIDFTVSAKKVLTMFKEEKAKFIVTLDQCYFAMIKPIEEELKELGLEQIVMVSASDSMEKVNRRNYLEEVYTFSGVNALVKTIVKTKRIAKMVKMAVKESPLEILFYKELIKESEEISAEEIPYYAGQLAVIVHTSGTTSARPKPIPLSHDNMNIYVHQTYSGIMPMETGDIALHMLPFFAAFGIVDVVHGGLCHGNNLIAIPEFSVSAFGKLICKYRPQTIIGAPSWFLALLKDSVLDGNDLSFLKMVTYGGDSMDIKDELALNAFLKEHGANCVVTKGHGMSETCGCASFASNSFNLPGTVGIPMSHTIYALVNPETKELLSFQEGMEYLEGELIISSGAVTSGELDGRVVVPHHEYGGENYIFTRDIARMDRNGIIKFLSRSDRAITRFDGFKIKPHEVETVIKSYERIKYCILSPVYDEKLFGNVTVADIVLKDGENLNRKEQVQFVEDLVQKMFTNNDNVSTRQIPKWFRFRLNLPITANSKIDYVALGKEKLNGNEIEVIIEETNMSVEKIMVR